jgi:thymidylate kinase
MSGLLEPGVKPGVLGVVRELFDRLDLEGIPYCHWKSNEHLGAAVAGTTDLDVLVASEASAALARTLDDTGFKRVVAVADRAYAGIEDFLALDAPTGRLAHLHLHHQLVLGEKGLKGYRLPWEGVMLATRRMDEEHAVYVADPHLELLLLIVRAALKLRTRDRIRSALQRPYFRGGMLNEFRWLVERVDEVQLVDTARPLVGARAADALAVLASGTPSALQLLAFRRLTEPGLSTYRMYGSVAARRERWRREWHTRWNSARQRRLGVPVPSKRTIPQGMVVAFMGCDGAGKSTVTEEVKGWLSWKLDVFGVYFGSGDGPASLLRRPLQLAKSLRRGRARWSGSAAASPARRQVLGQRDAGAPRSRVRELRKVWWALALAHEKRRRLAQAQRAREHGMVVICDRYPQSQFMGFNDGPRLSDWLQHRSRILRALAHWEHAVYQAATLQAPDLVVKLHVTPEVAARRKPEMPRDALPRRALAVKSLVFPAMTRVVDIDSDQVLCRVLDHVKQAIWEGI